MSSLGLERDLVDPILEGTLPVKGIPGKELLTEVLAGNDDERMYVLNVLVDLIFCDDEKYGFMVENYQPYSILVRVDKKGILRYRVVYDGYTPCPKDYEQLNDDDDDDDDGSCDLGFVYFDGRLECTPEPHFPRGPLRGVVVVSGERWW